MTIATIMVHLDANTSNTQTLQAAAYLGERLGAGVIGVAARQPMQVNESDGFYAGEVIIAERDIVEAELKALEAEFQLPTDSSCHRIGWRSTVTLEPLANYIANEARSADLIITGRSSSVLFDAARRVNTGDLVMRAGRPVLIIPEFAPKPWFERMIIAWKDTREARRAVSDAMPLLKIASQITIVEVADEGDRVAAQRRVDDVADWLKRHSLSATAVVSTSNGDDAESLASFVERNQADLVIAGAFGHSRIREWAFGGVSRDLLLRENRMVFLSH